MAKSARMKIPRRSFERRIVVCIHLLAFSITPFKFDMDDPMNATGDEQLSPRTRITMSAESCMDRLGAGSLMEPEWMLLLK
jgi:hypothetical protein